MKTAMTIIGVILLLATVLLFICGCGSAPPSTNSGHGSEISPVKPAIVRVQADQVVPTGGSTSGFTGSVNLKWQWPTNGNPPAYAATYAIVQETVDPSTSSGQGLGNWQSIATICYTSAPAYSFNVTNSPQMFFRLRETIPGLY